MPGADAPCQSNTLPYRYRAHDAMLRRLLSRSRFDESTHRLYDAMVERAREPVFFAELGVPDTLDGRFEMNVLHGLLIMRRLRRIEEGGADAAQSLFDLMFADFDSALRQIGVGDLKVGSRIKQMGQAYGMANSETIADIELAQQIAQMQINQGTGSPEVASETLSEAGPTLRESGGGARSPAGVDPGGMQTVGE